MNKLFITLVIMTSVAFNSQAQKKGDNNTMKNANDSMSYYIGLDLGENLQQNELGNVNIEMMMKGIQDQFDKKATTDVQTAREYIQEEFQRRAEAKALVEKQVGIKFLEENKKAAGVQTTASGLQYKVITEGKGIKPTASDTVEVHYHGTLINGTVFDSSVERGEKIIFPLSQVIPGWTEGVQLMSVGSKYQFFIPEHLAYGDRAMGEIKAYSTLIFEVELFDVKKAQ